MENMLMEYNNTQTKLPNCTMGNTFPAEFYLTFLLVVDLPRLPGLILSIKEKYIFQGVKQKH